jgi:GT2 family glycosyltransferase
MATISFSILNWNGLDDTIRCINSLLQSSIQDFRVYVLDNWSVDPGEFGRLQALYWSHSSIILNRSPLNLGFTWGNNYNLRLMLADPVASTYVCLLNNDCYVTPSFLKDFLATLDNLPTSKVGVYGPVIYNSDGSIQSAGSRLNLRLWTNPRFTRLPPSSEEVDCVSGSCFFIAREVLTEVWLLDDRFFAYREESDYCLRVKHAWYPITCLNVPWIVHKEETAIAKKKPYYTYLMFRNRILFLRKHASRLQFLFSCLVLVAYMALLFPRVFGVANFTHAWRGIRDGLMGTVSS